MDFEKLKKILTFSPVEFFHLTISYKMFFSYCLNWKLLALCDLFLFKGLLEYCTRILRRTPFIFCDFHGHSRRKNVFFFGCSNQESWLEADRNIPNVGIEHQVCSSVQYPAIWSNINRIFARSWKIIFLQLFYEWSTRVRKVESIENAVKATNFLIFMIKIIFLLG